jgi:hypothetical protein
MGAPAGYWMIDVASLDEAVAWASRCPAAAGEAIEVQRVQEFADLADDVQQALAQGIDRQADDADRDALCRRPVAVP